MKRWIALMMSVVMVLSMAACGSSASSSASTSKPAEPAQPAQTEQTAAPEVVEEETLAVYRTLYSGEVTTLNYLTTSNGTEQRIGANIIDTLVEFDSNGELKAGLAKSWSYDEDTLTWTFVIREGAKWVDCNGEVVADVTAQDFVDALRYTLNPENGSSTVQGIFGIIANAEEYFNGLAGAEGAEVIDFEEVGVKAVDDYTLTYTLCAPVPYFLSMLTYVTFMPAYGPQVEELGTGFAVSAETMYYCGAFYISEFAPQVRRVLTKNPTNWDAEHVYLDAIQQVYNAEADTIGPEMVKRGEIDYVELSADVADDWLTDPATADMVSMSRPEIDYMYFYCFNFNVYKLDENYYRNPEVTGYSIDEKYEPANWEVAVNNEAFRQSFRYAINRVSTMSVDTGDYADPATYMQNTITPVGFAVNEGVDYTAQPVFAEIMAKDSYDKDVALQYKAQAMEELAGKVTFPVKVLVRYNPSTTNWEDECVVLEQQLEAVLGTDYVDIIIEAGPSEGFLSAVRRSCDYMLMLCNWGADYADPETFTDPFYQKQNEDGSYNRGMRYAYLAYSVTDGLESAEVIAEYFRLVEAAQAIVDDTTARYAAFAEAEAYLINHALVVPYGTSVSTFCCSRLNPWDGQYAAFGVSNLRYKGQALLDHYLSMEEYEASAAQH